MRPAHRCSAAILLVLLAAAGRLAVAPPAVSGDVTAESLPVVGATVRFQGSCVAAITDARGRFRLEAPPGPARRVTASAPGHGIAAARLGPGPLRLRLPPLPTEDNEGYEWIDPSPDPGAPHNCANCHPEIHREHAASAHARAATNPRFLNLVGGRGPWALPAHKPDGAGVCAACHAPTFRDPTFEYDFRSLGGVAARGVHCDYCHKVVDAPTDRLGTRFGRDGLTLLRPAKGEQLFFGPLDDAVREGETFGHLPLYRESRYCASCHEGVVFGVHAYGTYSEWLSSDARRRGQQCQDCHMAPTGHLTNIAPGRGGVERDPRKLASHGFPGGQADMLRRCLTLTARATREGAAVRVEVEVRAGNVGHRVPTGFPDRNLVLVVEGLASDRGVSPITGPRLPPAAGKALTGLGGRLFAKQLRGAGGDAPAPFWAALDDGEDTRLTPGRPERSAWTFPATVTSVRVRLLYRRFWKDLADEHGWANNESLVAKHVVAVR